MSDFEERTIVVTGAASGLGLATSLQLAARGATVWALDKDPSAIGALRKLAENDGLRVYAHDCDVSDEGAACAAIREAAERHGSIDVLINNAGQFTARSFGESTASDWRAALDSNLVTAAICSRAAVPSMPRGSCIVNVSSNLAVIAEPAAPAYCCSKAALDMLTRCLAIDLAPRGIRCVGIAPGPIQHGHGEKCQMGGETFDYRRFNPLGRFASADEIAGIIAFLASPAAAYVTGTTFHADGGETSNPAAWSQLRAIAEGGRLTDV